MTDKNNWLQERERLQKELDKGLSIRQVAEKLGVTQRKVFAALRNDPVYDEVDSNAGS